MITKAFFMMKTFVAYSTKILRCHGFAPTKYPGGVSEDTDGPVTASTADHGRLFDDDLVADGDEPAGEDVGVQAAAVHQVLDDPRAGQPLQVGAGLTDLDP